MPRWGRPGGQTLEYAERDARAMAAPGAFTAAINWYRAMPLNNFLRLMVTKITVPTMHVFSDGDSFLSPKGAHASGRGVSGEYRFEVLHGGVPLDAGRGSRCGGRRSAQMVRRTSRLSPISISGPG